SHARHRSACRPGLADASAVDCRQRLAFRETPGNEIPLRPSGGKGRARSRGSICVRRRRRAENRSGRRPAARWDVEIPGGAAAGRSSGGAGPWSRGPRGGGEVMKRVARRNLLFEIVQAPSPRYRITIRIGAPGFPREEAADPSAFALKIRRQLTDDQRTLRVYGSEVVICRLTADARRARVHLLNYSRREIEGRRIRLRGAYPTGDARVAGVGALALQDRVVAGGATEFSLPRLTTYAVVDLTAAR